MTAEELYQLFKKEEEKGYYLHKNHEHCMETLESLIENLNNYGYLNCPCRLANNDAEKDRHTTCPCVYRNIDVKEHGACFCHLFVSEEHKDDENFFPEIDDRIG